MQRELILLVVISILAMNLTVAGSYALEFNQTGNILLVKESINGTPTENYLDSQTLNLAGNEIYFLKKITFPGNFENVSITLNLEQGIVIKNQEIFPIGYKIETDGQTIFIVWNLSNVKKGDNFAIFVNLEDTKNKGLSPLAISLLIFIPFGIFWFIVLKRKSKLAKKIMPKKIKNVKEKEFKEYNYLLDTEKKVVEELKKADRNELWQKQIQNSTGFSKAKVSRLIRNLESRGLITKIPFGNTNKIRLK